MQTEKIYANVWRDKIPPTKERFSEPSLTQPGQAIDIATAAKHFTTPSIDERMKVYYDEAGIELPNFERMSYVERLTSLAESREQYKAAKQKVDLLDDLKAQEEKRKTYAQAKELEVLKSKTIPSQDKSEKS